MYNRYVPQQDGSHRKNRIEDTPKGSPNRPSPPPAPPPPAPPCPEHHPHPEYHPSASPIGGFLRQLLPKDFDTGDLIVVLLLLLMAGDKPEDRNTALLTLALYCFL